MSDKASIVAKVLEIQSKLNQPKTKEEQQQFLQELEELRRQLASM